MTVYKHLLDLVPQQSGKNRLVPRPDRGAIPGGRGVGRRTKAEEQEVAGGWTSPLTELAQDSRTYFGTAFVTSSDGLFVQEIEPLQTLKMTDDVGVPVEQVFQNPYA